jgi:hypothetical protein
MERIGGEEDTEESVKEEEGKKSVQPSSVLRSSLELQIEVSCLFCLWLI